MSKFVYGVVRFVGAVVGDPVRYVPSNVPGQPGAILKPRHSYEINSTLRQLKGTLGYVELKPQLASPQARSEGGTAAAIKIDVPLTIGGSLLIT